MSDFFRIPVPPEIASAGIVTLARLTHEAEETDDDVLLMQCAAVVEHRGEQELFRRTYIEMWHVKMQKRQPQPDKSTTPTP